MAATDFTRRTVKVTYSNGDHVTATINGTVAEVKAHYRIGRRVNLGYGGADHIVKITRLQFLDPASKADARGHRRRRLRVRRTARSRR